MPRAGLSADVIVNEAATILDEAGPDRLTLAEVANRFGVAPPSLYKHVAGIEHLRRLLAVKTMCEAGDALRRAATGKARSEALRAVAHAYRDYARTRPGCYETILRAPGSDDEELAAAARETLSVFYDVFAGYGIHGDDAVDAARYLRSTLHGFVSLELVGGFAMPRSVDRSFDRLVTAADNALANWSPGPSTASDAVSDPAEA